MDHQGIDSSVNTPTTHRWTKAAALRYGTHLTTPTGTTATALGGHNAHTRTGWMWDLTVTTDHDFYVHTAVGVILVHNCPSAGPEDPGGGTSPQPGPKTMRAVWDWVYKTTSLGGDAGATRVPPFSRSAYGNLSDEVRNEVLANNPTCVYCGVNPATELITSLRSGKTGRPAGGRMSRWPAWRG